jgi:hypothetical protein
VVNRQLGHGGVEDGVVSEHSLRERSSLDAGEQNIDRVPARLLIL